MHFSGAAEWRELTKTVFFILFFCILSLHVSLEQIYLERQLTLKEILPLEEVRLCFVYSPAWILHCCLVHKGPCIIWTRMIWYDLSLSTAPATFVGRWKVLRGHKVGHGVLWEGRSLAHKRGFVFRLQFEAGFISLIRCHHHNLKIAGSNITACFKGDKLTTSPSPSLSSPPPWSLSSTPSPSSPQQCSLEQPPWLYVCRCWTLMSTQIHFCPAWQAWWMVMKENMNKGHLSLLNRVMKKKNKKGYVMLLNMVVKKKINYGCVSLLNLVMKKKDMSHEITLRSDF